MADARGHVAEIVEDHALNRVPEEQRKTGWALSWLTMGIVTTLVQLLIGSYVTAVAGIGMGVLAGVLVALFGGGLGYVVGIIAFREGTSSTVTSRFYGFGARGSFIASVIFAFMILGFLALENALLYYGTLFALGLQPSTLSEIVIYGILTIGWILLTRYGVGQVMRVASILTVLFLALLVFMIYRAGIQSVIPFAKIITHGALIPGMGSLGSRLAVALVALAGSAGALALVDMDYARYAKSAKDVAVMAFAGSAMLDIIVLLAGSIIIFGGTGDVIQYLVGHHMATQAGALAQANAMAQNNTGAYFVVLSTLAGFLLMYFAQAKAQVLNTYSGSLALTNFFDALISWRPGRWSMVILGNVIGLVMVAGGILPLITEWLNALGIFTTSFCAVMIADFYFVRRRSLADRTRVEEWNWAGITSIVVGSLVSLWLENANIFPLGFLAALIITAALYPVLRTWVIRPEVGTRLTTGSLALTEKE